MADLFVLQPELVLGLTQFLLDVLEFILQTLEFSPIVDVVKLLMITLIVRGALLKALDQ
jgi:hypothetical protein